MIAVFQLLAIVQTILIVVLTIRYVKGIPQQFMQEFYIKYALNVLTLAVTLGMLVFWSL